MKRQLSSEITRTLKSHQFLFIHVNTSSVFFFLIKTVLCFGTVGKPILGVHLVAKKHIPSFKIYRFFNLQFFILTQVGHNKNKFSIIYFYSFTGQSKLSNLHLLNQTLQQTEKNSKFKKKLCNHDNFCNILRLLQLLCNIVIIALNK